LVLCLMATPTIADMSLRFHIDKATFTYDAATQRGTIGLASNASMAAALLDGGTELDNTGIQNGVPSTPDFAASMTLQFAQSGTDWTATSLASLTIGDTVGNRVQADFVASSVTLTPITITTPTVGPLVVGGVLVIAGGLQPAGGNEAILAGATAGNPWTYAGESQTGDGGSDGLVNQITVQNWESSDTGVLVALNVSGLMGIPDLNTLFGADRSFSNGTMDVNVGVAAVPVPAAILLASLGLGVAGLGLRRFT